MMIRIQSRDGVERLPIPTPNPTISTLKTLIETQLSVPIPSQTISTDRNLLLSKSPDDVARFGDMVDGNILLSSLGVGHGSIVYLAYEGERTVIGAGGVKVTPAGSFGKKMTMEDLIAKQMRVTRVPIPAQTFSTDRSILLIKSPADVAWFGDMVDGNTPLSALGISHGSTVYLAYEGERTVAPTGVKVSPAGSFGRKMTMKDLIAKQMRVTRQENPHCELVSFDRDAANAFQQYVNETLAFAVKRCGFMYGTVSPEGKVEVDLIYEPPQLGTEDALILLRDPEEEKVVDAIAMNLGMRKVGFIFTQTIGQNKKDYTLSNSEVLQAVELQAEGDLKEWVTAVVKLEVNEDGGADVHFEAFQMSDMCVRLFKEGWFDTERRENEEIDPKLSRMKKDVIVGGKDMKEVDNDFFLVVVKIADHQGPLTTTFPVENRNIPVTMRALKNHLERSRGLSFVKRISDFHLLLLVSKFLDLNADVPALAECVHTQSAIPEGYQLLIESLAASS